MVVEEVGMTPADEIRWQAWVILTQYVPFATISILVLLLGLFYANFTESLPFKGAAAEQARKQRAQLARLAIFVPAGGFILVLVGYSSGDWLDGKRADALYRLILWGGVCIFIAWRLLRAVASGERALKKMERHKRE